MLRVLMLIYAGLLVTIAVGYLGYVIWLLRRHPLPAGDDQ